VLDAAGKPTRLFSAPALIPIFPGLVRCGGKAPGRVDERHRQIQ
jgi:hypothetical protein